jgi:bisanhydrobacterioruberin hydratase
MASFIIVLNALVTLLSESRSMSLAKAAGIFLGLASILFLVEYAGITTGSPFGAYVYTDALGFRVAGVPIAISFAWYATVVTTWRIARFFADRSPSALLVPLTAGLLTVAIDVALEPMASGITGYWHWRTATIPLQNYAAWFAFTFLAALLLQRVGPEPREQTKGHAINAFVLAGMQWVLFMSTDILHGYYAGALLSAGILALAVALLWLSKQGPTPTRATT